MTLTRLSLIGIVLALVAACAPPPPAPQDKYYRLSVDSPTEPAARPIIAGTLEVSRFLADGQIAGRPIIYVDPAKPLELNEHAYHFWNQPPAVMMQDQMTAFLRAANAASVVVTPDMRVSPDMVLQGRILRLERHTGSHPRVALKLELGLVKNPDDKLIFLDTYAVELDAGDGTVSASVTALNDALAVIFERFLADIRKI
ncbi:MAG: ABC-type transport auxiliary lipoprotein family protein [Rhodospirillales bacterium]